MYTCTPFFSVLSIDRSSLSARAHAQDRTHPDAAVRRRIRCCSFLNTETLTNTHRWGQRGAGRRSHRSPLLSRVPGGRREHVWNQLPGEEQHPPSDGKTSDRPGQRRWPENLSACVQIPAANAGREGIKFLVRRQRAEGPLFLLDVTANPRRRGDDS